MNKTAERFKAEILRRLDEVTEGQDEAIHEAATIFANTIERGGIIRAFGSGHSYANALEICGRSGRNPLSIDMARIAQERGIKTIVVTALEVSRAGTSRHKSGRLLYEYGDVVLDNRSAFGDAAIDVEGLDTKVGGTSLYTGCLLLDCAIMESLDILVGRGIQPPVFKSANIDGGPEFNQRLLDTFKDRLAEF